MDGEREGGREERQTYPHSQNRTSRSECGAQSGGGGLKSGVERRCYNVSFDCSRLKERGHIANAAGSKRAAR
eukprot:523583-Rhodomonas_salina.2